jgi:two-component system osmolarity sensor histidine kinase EnvZ
VNLIARSIIKAWVPRGLLGRSLLIVILPLIFVQLISTYIFFDRHWESITRQFADNIAGGIATTALWYDAHPGELGQIQNFVQRTLAMEVSLVSRMPQGAVLGGEAYEILLEALRVRIGVACTIIEADQDIQIYVPQPMGALQYKLPRKKLFSKTTPIYLAWSLGASLVMLIIAALFMRNQVRPLQRLAEAAENFGKGREIINFRPAGAREIRRAGVAFIVMRERIRRHMQERVQMLAGVSHDLRTPLTRMKLQLAIAKKEIDVEALHQDIVDMEHMIEVYLDFARSAIPESVTVQKFAPFIGAICRKLDSKRIELVIASDFEPNLEIQIKPNTLYRALENLLANALRYGYQKVLVHLNNHRSGIEILIDDDGPGIPPERRAEVFRPFIRLDSSRNQATGGVGLGLAIARDGIRRHGGYVVLGDSPLGGLRIRVYLPK